MFILIFEQLLKMFFIMVLAFVCFKIGLVDQTGNKTVSNLLLLVVNPVLIITVYQTKYDPALVRGLLLAFAAAAATHVLGILISTALIRPKIDTDYSIERFNAMYSNCGFIGIPLIGSVLGDTGVFYLSAYMVMFNLFSWTHGVILMEKRFSFKNLSIHSGNLSHIKLPGLKRGNDRTLIRHYVHFRPFNPTRSRAVIVEIVPLKDYALTGDILYELIRSGSHRIRRTLSIAGRDDCYPCRLKKSGIRRSKADYHGVIIRGVYCCYVAETG